MAVVTVNGVPIPVAPGGLVEAEPEVFGDVMRTFSGAERNGTRTRKRSWSVTTRLLTAAEYASVRAALTAAPPLAVMIDGEAFTCSAHLKGGPLAKAGGLVRQVLSFELRER